MGLNKKYMVNFFFLLFIFCLWELISSVSWLALLREPEQTPFMERCGLRELAFCCTDCKTSCKAGYKVMPLLVKNKWLGPHCILQKPHGWTQARSASFLHFLPADISALSLLSLLLQLSHPLVLVMSFLPKSLLGLASMEPLCWGGAGSFCMALSALRPETHGLWSGSWFGWWVSSLFFEGKKTKTPTNFSKFWLNPRQEWEAFCHTLRKGLR